MLVAMHQNVLTAETAQDLVTAIASDLFRGALIPVENSSIASDQVHADVETVQDGLEDLRILKFHHAP
jgi:hypothetical protein